MPPKPKDLQVYSATNHVEDEDDDDEENDDDDDDEGTLPVKRRAPRGTYSKATGCNPKQLSFYPACWIKCIKWARDKMNLHVALTDHFLSNKHGHKLAAQFIGEAVVVMEENGEYLEEGKCWCSFHALC